MSQSHFHQHLAGHLVVSGTALVEAPYGKTASNNTLYVTTSCLPQCYFLTQFYLPVATSPHKIYIMFWRITSCYVSCRAPVCDVNKSLSYVMSLPHHVFAHIRLKPVHFVKHWILKGAQTIILPVNFNATVLPSVCLFVHPCLSASNNSAPRWPNFHGISQLYCEVLLNFCVTFLLYLKSDKKDNALREHLQIFTISLYFGRK
jgi:hypothetical protein